MVRTVTTDTFSMDFIKFGSGAKPFVILPGLSVQSVMGAADAVAGAYQALTDDYTVYVFDRRKELPETYGIYDMAMDTAKAMQALGLEQVTLFGASQGGMMAMEIAAAHPEMTAALVLGSTSAFVTAEQVQVIEGWITLAKERKAEDLYMAFGEAVYPPEVFEQSKGLLTDAAKTVTDEEMARFVILGEALKGFDVTDKLRSITCPVLILGDRDDRVLGGVASVKIAQYLAGCPNLELHMYKGFGHAAYDTAPDYKQRILDFLRKG